VFSTRFFQNMSFINGSLFPPRNRKIQTFFVFVFLLERKLAILTFFQNFLATANLYLTIVRNKIMTFTVLRVYIWQFKLYNLQFRFISDNSEKKIKLPNANLQMQENFYNYLFYSLVETSFLHIFFFILK